MNAPCSSMKKQRSASPSHAIPRSAPVSRTSRMMNSRFFAQQRVGLVVGEVPVGRPVGLDQLESEITEDRPDHRPGHPVAAVDHDLERLDHVAVDEPGHVLVELVIDRDLLDAAAAGRVAQTASIVGADIADPGVARQRDRPALYELGAGVGLGVVGGGAHQASVEVARADQEIEHLGPDLAGIDHDGALAAPCPRGRRRRVRARSGACRVRAPGAAPRRACPPGRRSPVRTTRPISSADAASMSSP